MRLNRHLIEYKRYYTYSSHPHPPPPHTHDVPLLWHPQDPAQLPTSLSAGQIAQLPLAHACKLWAPSLCPVGFSSAVAAADERPNPSAAVHGTFQGGSSGSWTSLLHVVKPLIAVVAATTGLALLAQLFIRYVTITAALMPLALCVLLTPAHLFLVVYAADSSCAGNI